MKHTKFIADGIHCNSCSNKIKKALSDNHQATDVSINVEQGSIDIQGEFSAIALKNSIESIGFKITHMETTHE
ncbi:MAG: heavy-metal-associated domain-containing protein [Oligoflexales bacterium]|nr:heavy-metal-associated domain-containing protein [Oligoflexales bacterium]